MSNSKVPWWVRFLTAIGLWVDDHVEAARYVVILLWLLAVWLLMGWMVVA